MENMRSDRTDGDEYTLPDVLPELSLDEKLAAAQRNLGRLRILAEDMNAYLAGYRQDQE